MKKLLLLLLGLLPALPSLAREFKYTYEGQTITYTIIDEEAKTCKTTQGISGYAGNQVLGDLVLPSHPKDGDSDFTLTEIGSYAFRRCSGLTSITIPNSVTYIGAGAFEGCSGLTDITVSEENQHFSHENGVLFNKNKSVIITYPGGKAGSYSIPDSVTRIGNYAFKGCSGLTSVTIPNSVKTIGNYAFEGCSGLISATIPNSVTSIGFYAFEGCSGLISATIPNSVTSIGEGAFLGCSGLTSVTIPNSVTYIGWGAFSGCSGLTSVTIPNSVTKIGDEAFYGCSGLTSVTIGNSVKTIGEGAFSGCTGLTSVTIPNSVKTIGNYAFSGCTGLTSVTYLAEKPIQSESDLFDDKIYEKATLNYLKTADREMATTIPWSLFKNRIGRDADFVDSISEVYGPENEATAVYDMRGVRVGDSLEGLPHGVYIIRQGSKTTKHAI